MSNITGDGSKRQLTPLDFLDAQTLAARPEYRSLLERIIAHVDVQPDHLSGEGGCWLYRSNHPTGYAYVKIHGRSERAHRIIDEICTGRPVPEGWDVDHMCHLPTCLEGQKCLHRRCIRPRHLRRKPHHKNTDPGRRNAGGTTQEQPPEEEEDDSNSKLPLHIVKQAVDLGVKAKNVLRVRNGIVTRKLGELAAEWDISDYWGREMKQIMVKWESRLAETSSKPRRLRSIFPGPKAPPPLDLLADGDE